MNSEKINKSTYSLKKKQAQEKMTELNIGITFYNIFSRGNKLRKNPDRFLLCYCESKHNRDAACAEARRLGWICKKTTKEPFDAEKGYHVIQYIFSIDLESLN